MQLFLLISLFVFSINCIMLIIYPQKYILINRYNAFISLLKIEDKSQNDFMLIENSDSTYNLISSNNSIDIFNNIETKRLQDLRLERIQLKNKLKMLEFITTFEMYLDENKVVKDRFSQFQQFSALKLEAQSSILESTRRVSNLSAA